MHTVKEFLVLRAKSDTLYCSMKCLVADGGDIFEKLYQFTEIDRFNHLQDWEDQENPQECRDQAGSRWGYLCPVCERPYEDVLI